MSLLFGRLDLDDPESFPESVGEAYGRVGAMAVPGARSGLSTSIGLTSFPANLDDTNGDRQRVRRQLRSLLNNLPMKGRAVYLAWTEDPELDGWYVTGTGTFDLPDGGALQGAFWRFTGIDLALTGRARTHRRAVSVYLRDRRGDDEPRDHLRRVYSTDFAAMATAPRTWLPSHISDPTYSTLTNLSLSTSRGCYGGGLIQAALSATDLAVISFEQAAAYRNLGDVVAYDRRGTLTSPTTGPDDAWEEVYGSDWPCSTTADWAAGDDAPVLDNGISRVRFVEATASFALDRWSGSAWAEVGRILIQRRGLTTGFADILVSAQLVEWAPERAVAKCVMRRGADTASREEVYITLQRGWTGPRFEVYPAPLAAGGTSGAAIHVYRATAPGGTDTANKYDASLQTQTGAPNFGSGTAVGATTFSGENWIVMRRSGEAAVVLAVLQDDLRGQVETSSTAYGSTRNGISVRNDSGGYVGAHVGMNDASTTDAIDSVNGQQDGARDLGREVLVDSRSPQTIVSR
jgi:hypothetical protein